MSTISQNYTAGILEILILHYISQGFTTEFLSRQRPLILAFLVCSDFSRCSNIFEYKNLTFIIFLFGCLCAQIHKFYWCRLIRRFWTPISERRDGKITFLKYSWFAPLYAFYCGPEKMISLFWRENKNKTKQVVKLTKLGLLGSALYSKWGSLSRLFFRIKNKNRRKSWSQEGPINVPFHGSLKSV